MSDIERGLNGSENEGSTFDWDQMMSEGDGELTEFDEELFERATNLHIRLQEGKVERLTIELLHNAGGIIRLLREGQDLSSDSLARAINKDYHFVAFLESGLVELEEITPELRESLSMGLGVNIGIVNLIFDPRHFIRRRYKPIDKD
jgi:hypothetical protein